MFEQISSQIELAHKALASDDAPPPGNGPTRAGDSQAVFSLEPEGAAADGSAAEPASEKGTREGATAASAPSGPADSPDGLSAMMAAIPLAAPPEPSRPETAGPQTDDGTEGAAAAIPRMGAPSAPGQTPVKPPALPENRPVNRPLTPETAAPRAAAPEARADDPPLPEGTRATRPPAAEPATAPGAAPEHAPEHAPERPSGKAGSLHPARPDSPEPAPDSPSVRAGAPRPGADAPHGEERASRQAFSTPTPPSGGGRARAGEVAQRAGAGARLAASGPHARPRTATAGQPASEGAMAPRQGVKRPKALAAIPAPAEMPPGRGGERGQAAPLRQPSAPAPGAAFGAVAPGPGSGRVRQGPAPSAHLAPAGLGAAPSGQSEAAAPEAPMAEDGREPNAPAVRQGPATSAPAPAQPIVQSPPALTSPPLQAAMAPGLAKDRHAGASPDEAPAYEAPAGAAETRSSEGPKPPVSPPAASIGGAPDLAPMQSAQPDSSALPDQMAPGHVEGAVGAGETHRIHGAAHVSGPVRPPAPEHVSAQIVRAAGLSQDGPIELRLDPEELGSVRMHMHLKENGTMVLNILAERPDTLDLMRRHADQLGAQMREAGYDSLDIAFGSPHGGQAGHAGDEGAPAAPARAMVEAPGPQAQAGGDPAPHPRAAEGRIDIRL